MPKKHTKDTPKKYKILNSIVPILRKCQEEVEAHGEDGDVQVWRIIRSLGRMEQRRDVLEVEDSKMHSGRVATSSGNLYP